MIAIQNVRLFNETKVALEHQTAAGDVLQVISGSMADADPVFEKILDSCQRLFCATDLGIFLVDGQERLEVGAYRGGFADWAPGAYPRPLAGTMSEMVIRHGALMHWGDMAQARDVPGYIRDAVRRSGNFAVSSAPLVWEGQGIGTIDVMRRPPARTARRARAADDLRRSGGDHDPERAAVQRNQGVIGAPTATSDVLRVISRSVTDTQPVFDVIAERAARLTGANPAGCSGSTASRFTAPVLSADPAGPGLGAELLSDAPERCVLHLARHSRRQRRQCRRRAGRDRPRVRDQGRPAAVGSAAC